MLRLQARNIARLDGGQRALAGASLPPSLLPASTKMVAMGDSGTQFNTSATFVPFQNITSALVSRTTGGGGTGYTVGDILTIAGGTGMTSPRQVQVATVSAGVVSTVTLVSYGASASRTSANSALPFGDSARKRRRSAAWPAGAPSSP